MEPKRNDGAGERSRKSFSTLREYLRNPSAFMFFRELKRSLRDCSSVLDVGCGTQSPLRFVSWVQKVGVDGHQPSLEQARASGTHDEYILADVRHLQETVGPRRFDACVALDVIEHLPKEDGWVMLREMESLATRRVIIFTPNGFLPQKSRDGDLQEHLSGWTAADFRSKGFRVFGMYGPKTLRGEYHRIKRPPAILWLAISFALHYLKTRQHPAQATALFCVKDLPAS